MREQETELKRRRIAVVVVTFDQEAMARHYVESTQLSWPLLLDAEKELYRAYGFEKADLWAIYGPASIWHYLKLLAGGHKLKRPGKDLRQLGGDVIIDPAGMVRYHFASESPHDRPTVENLLNVVDACSSPD